MSIFARRKRSPPPPPDLARLFGRLLGREPPAPPLRRSIRGPSRPAGGGQSSSFALRREAEEFLPLESAEPASLLLAWLETEAPSFALLCPEAEREPAIEALLALSQLALPGDGGATPIRPILTLQPATKAAIEAVLLRIGLASAYEFGAFRLLAANGIVRSIEARLLEDGLEEALAHARARAATQADTESPDFLRIERPADLVASRLFLPARFPVGGLEAGVFWDSLALEPVEPSLIDAAPGEGEHPEELWFSALAGRPGGQVFFSCAGAREGREAFAARVRPILEAGWSRAAALISGGGSAASSPGLTVSAAPEPGGLEGGLRIGAELRIGGGGFRLSVHLPAAFLRLLLGASGARAEGLFGNRALCDFLAANQALLERWRESYPASSLAPRRPSGAAAAPGLPTIPSILGFLGPSEAALILQNCLLPSLGPKEFARLFYRRMPAKPGDRARLLPLQPFSESRILQLLPSLAREEWENERATAFGGITWRAEEAIAANESAARLVHAALVAGRLALSPASRKLLEAELGERIAAEGRAELEALAAAGLPFGLLDSLNRAELIRLLGPFSNRELALGILGDEGRLPLLKKAMSSSRLRQFGEELEAATKRFGRGELSAAELAAAKRELRAGLELRLKKLADERRGGLGPGARPGRLDKP